MSEHAWVQENLDAFFVGGLSAQECERVERHVKSCRECASLKAEIGEMEHLMEGICARVRPDAGLEDRAIQRLRRAPRPRPSWLRFAAAAAAVVLLGMVGGVVRMLALDGTLPLPGMEEQVALHGKKKDGFRFGPDIIGGSLEGHPRRAADKNLKQIGLANKALAGEDGSKLDSALSSNSRIDLAEIREGKGTPGSETPPPAKVGDLGQGGAMDAGTHFFPEKHPPASDDKAKIVQELKFYDNEMKGRDQQDKVVKSLEKALKELDGKEDLSKKPDAMMLVKPEPTAKSPAPSGTPSANTYSQPTNVPPGPSAPKIDVPPALFPSTMLPPGPATAAPPPAYLPMTPPPVVTGTEKPAEGKPGDDSGKKDDVKTGPKKSPAETPAPPKAEQPKEPEKTGRMIIRTGEMEFETDSFDKARDTIGQLITGVKGGFIATVNRDTLPNGKTKGAVVVRMPPTSLDKFILDLRRDLAKSSELKSERLGSLDITKQYTDIESRLRAARAIEERLINIIKTGKGEIKDLVAAEKELGVWRTKIEEMEGEIRYYANQVSLSTLTITLTEKEIQSPTAIVITETVSVRIEVEDVAKAHQIAMKAVEDLKGRITRSELKQHTAGQFLSVLYAEIAPDKKDKFFDQLKKLGIISDHQENQRQHTEGGSGKAPELKPKQSDVVFQVTMNNTANIRPRVSTDLKISSTDVPGAYAKLLDKIAEVKGQVRDGKLNEQDKLNIHAHLDFNVPTAKKPAIDELLEKIGPVLERVNIQAPVNELSTASKFGYTLLIRDFASIPPRETLLQTIAAVKVPAAYAQLQDAIAKAKGLVADAKLNEQDKLNITAQLEFTVPTKAKGEIEKVLKSLGIELARVVVQAPAKQLASAEKFGFSILLRDIISVPARQSLVQTVATADVPAAYAKLQDAVAKADGTMVDAKLNEMDKLNVTAQLEFTVPIAAKADIEKLLESLGAVLSRNNVKIPANQLAVAEKFGFSLFLRDFAGIPPSKASDLKVATNDVPGSYAKLLDAITNPKVKGQIVDARLNEQDKFNISAQIAFSVPTEEKAGIDKLLADIGTVLSRTNMQTPVNQLSIAKKFGYTILLRDFANILPSHAADIKLASNDVPGNYAKLVEAVVKAKGQISAAKLNELDKLNVSAFLNFTVPIGEKPAIDKLLAQVGTMLSRNNVQAPTSELTTDRKFGYAISLRDFANIPARETFTLRLAAVDVAAAFRELQDAITAAKGQIFVGQLTEDNKVKMEATLYFDVPAAERQAIEKLFGKVGAIDGRTSTQVPVNDLATDQKVGFKLTIRSTASILPRETVHVKLEVKDVDGRATDLKEMVIAAKGRVMDSNIERHENGTVIGVLLFEVPFASEDSLLKQIKGVGTVVSQQAKRNQVAENDLTTAHIAVTLAGVTPIVPSDEGLSSYVRTSLYMSFKVFSVCLMLIILGVSAVLPWALVIWIAYKVYARFAGSRSLPVVSAAGPTPPSAPAAAG